MDALVAHGWSVVAVPLAVAVVIAGAGRWLGRAVAACAAVAPAWVAAVGIAASARLLPAGGGEALAGGAVEWLGAGLEVGWLIDGLAALMLVVVGVVALLVVVFSDGYLAADEARPRYFAALALFTAAMSLLVVADGFVGLFIGWELVGACSYLLIGHWFTRPAAVNAAVKAFLTTRVGDAGLLLALAILFAETGDLSYEAVFAAVPGMPAATVTVISLLLLVGAAGKSAQFPLHIWLPDAMEGPTPVSALIHAATMVAAGVFVLARAWPLVGASPDALTVTLAIGTLTALAAAAAAVAQRDIKRMLAYSTISQLGFMFAAIGAGAWTAAMFHLVTHAAFKALLFLGAGSLIHATGTQRIASMGGLARAMPLTAVTWFAAAAALAGIPPLSGFFSKDKVLEAVWKAEPVWGVALFAASALTALYITRATVLVFFGAYRGDGRPHEGAWPIRVPLTVLAVFAAVLGFAAGPVTLLAGGTPAGIDLTVAAAATAVALLGGAAGALSARGAGGAATPLSGILAAPSRWAEAGWGWDALVAAAVARPTAALARALDLTLDRGLIDRVVEGTASASRLAGRGFSALQSGDAQWYATMAGAGAVALLALVAYVGRGL